MTTDAAAYVAALPPGRREVLGAVRDTINANLQPGFEEGSGYSAGIITWTIAGDRSPPTYNNRPLVVAALGNWRNYMSVYLMCLVHDPRERRWFTESCQRAGKRLDLGRMTLRFRRLDDLALDVVAEHIRHTTVDSLIAAYESAGAR